MGRTNIPDGSHECTCIIPEYTTTECIYLHLPEWLVIPCLLERVVTFFNEVYMTDFEAVFLKRQNLIFSIVARSSSLVFCFRLNILTSEISNLLSLLVAERADGRGSLILIYPFLCLPELIKSFSF